MNLQEGRDVIIIIVGALSILLLTAMIAFTVVVGLATRTLLGTVRTLLADEVTPLVQSVRQTVQRVTGTVTFVSETIVSPVIRLYGVFAGVRRAAGVMGGIRNRGKSDEKQED